MTTCKRWMLSMAIALTGFAARAQEDAANIEFVENRGQWDREVLLRGQLPNGYLFLQKNGFSVALHNPDELMQVTHARLALTSSGRGKSLERIDTLSARVLHSHNYRVQFEGADPAAEIMPDKPLPGYSNYFLGHDPAKWAAHCQGFQGVTYRNVYPGIDVRYYSVNGKLKYDIIAHPGADIGRIALRYTGVGALAVKNNQLSIRTNAGPVTELKPYSYQVGNAGREEVRCRYVVKSGDSVVRFSVRGRDPQQTLVIDPTLVFCSFTGSAASNWGFTATPGPDGSFFAGGIVFAQGFPVNPGAFQTKFASGEFDVGIIKFSANGRNRLYATYLGGAGTEAPHSMFADPQGNLVVMGRTNSNTTFPYLSRPGPGGGTDMFVCKLTADGSGLIGSMLIGGTGSDCVNISDQLNGESKEAADRLIKNYGDDSRSEVILDGARNIYVAASSQSQDFPVTAGVFQPKFGGGLQDGVVLKIDPDCKNLVWASFLGGTKEDAGFVLKLNPANQDIFVAGATASADFPGSKAGAYQATYQGGISDAFVAIISNDGKTLRKSTFMGTPQFDGIYGIDFDRKGFPYVMGITLGTWPTTANVQFINEGAKQFVTKLRPDLSGMIYSTTFGRKAALPNISPVAFLVDRCENVYVSGWGGWLFNQALDKDTYGMSGTIGMPVSRDAVKSITDGRDFYFIVIQKNAASLLYATFFGQTESARSISEHVDGGTSRYDQNGVIYQAICANCGAGSLTPFPTTPGVWGPRNGTGGLGCNEAAVKIAFNLAGITADVRPLINGIVDSSGCVPLTVNFVDTFQQAKQYIWNFGDGTPDSPATAHSVFHTYNSTGTFPVRIIAIDSNSCNVADTVYVHVRVRTDRAQIAFTDAKVPPCQSLTYTFQSTSVAPPGKPFGAGTFTWDFGDGSPRLPATAAPVAHAFPAAGSYIVRLVLNDSNYCNFPDSAVKTLHISPLVKAVISTPSQGCAPYTVTFGNASLGGETFEWDFGDGNTSTDYAPTHTYPETGTYTVKLHVIDPSSCNLEDRTQMTLTVNPKPTAGFTEGPVPPQPNSPAIFTNTALGATQLIWYFGDDDSTVSANVDTVMHQYKASFTFQACQVALNQYQCADTVCHPVEALINPLLDVPNAFTPGRGGANSIIAVRGFGITAMNWKIYNRWGQVVFQSNDPDIGWDGTYRGAPQPVDVYTYTLEATFSDGTRTTKKGDITLIR